MLHFRRVSLLVLTLVAALQGGDALLHAQDVSTNVLGNNDPRRMNGLLYVSSGALTTRTTQSGGLMRVETYLEGYWFNHTCGVPTSYGGYSVVGTGLGDTKEGVWLDALGACYNEVTGTYSHAEHLIMNEVPFGWYSGYGHHWWIRDDGLWVGLGQTSASRFFTDPPPDDCESDPTSSSCPNTPIIIRLSPSGHNQNDDTLNDKGRKDYKLTGPQNGVYFDIDGNGRVDRIGWTAPNTELAFLAIDRNGNGTIDDGTELFGNHTLSGVDNGFKALRLLSGVEASTIDATSPFWSKLLLWTDRNHDGISQPDELQPVSNVLTKIGLGYSVSVITDASGRRVLDTPSDPFGNVFKYRGWVEYRDDIGKVGKSRMERQRPCYDVVLASR